MLRRAIGSGRTVMTHAAVTGHNAVMTMSYSPLPMQAPVDSLLSAADCVSNRAALLRLFILCDFLFHPSFKVFTSVIFFLCFIYIIKSAKCMVSWVGKGSPSVLSEVALVHIASDNRDCTVYGKCSSPISILGITRDDDCRIGIQTSDEWSGIITEQTATRGGK
jgi:hypothetical protein